MRRKTHGPAVAPGEFRAAMALLASPIALVATRDPAGRPWGLTASSVTSVSLDPPLLLVCVARASSCHPALTQAEEFTVNVLAEHHRRLARLFATPGADRFADGAFQDWGESAVPYLPDAAVSLRCTAFDHKAAGDHDVLFGLPTQIRFGAAGEPLIWHRRGFYPAGSAAAGPDPEAAAGSARKAG